MTNVGSRRRVLTVRRAGGTFTHDADLVVMEEPLEIRVGGASGPDLPWAVTMRTPGHDEELAVGLLFGDGAFDRSDEILSLRRTEESDTIEVRLATPPPPPAAALRRRSSACGVCARESLDEVRALVRRRARPASLSVAASVVAGLAASLRRHQPVFDETGGLHAAGLFEADGTVVVVREDVGRHNAVDKVVGSRLRAGAGVPPLLAVSGRLGFEIVQKAAVSGVALVVSVSAPSSLAIELAEECGITLAGFARGDAFNLYTHSSRVSV